LRIEGVKRFNGKTAPMSGNPISPLPVCRFIVDTQREYIRAVKGLAALLGRPPDTPQEDTKTVEAK